MTHRRTLILVVVVAALTVVVGTGTAAGQSAPDCSQVSYNGDGTEQNPYEVGNVDQLQCINETDLSADYTSPKEIDMNTSSVFSQPLPGFNNPPTNTGELGPDLYEDIDGDGDGLDPSQSVQWWTQIALKPNEYADLTQEQVDELDWNADGGLSCADATTLWSQQVQAVASLEESAFPSRNNNRQPVSTSISSTVISKNATVLNDGDTGTSIIKIKPENGVGVAQLNITLDTSVAEIINVTPGEDVKRDAGTVFDVISRTPGSVRIEYANIGASSVEEFELAEVELESQTSDGEATVGLGALNITDENCVEYDIQTDEGQVSTFDGFFVNVSKVQPVEGGKTISFEASVTNSGGGTEQKQNITAEIPGIGTDTTTITLDAGQSTNVTFEIPTQESDISPNPYTLTVSSEDYSDSTEVGVGAKTVLRSQDVLIPQEGGTAESNITINARRGVSIANAEVSVNSSVAEIVEVKAGSDVDTDKDFVTFSVRNQTADSARIDYTNVGASSGLVTGFELAKVVLEANASQGETPIEVTPDGVFDGDTNEYQFVSPAEGNVTIGPVFTEPLPIPEFAGRPQNIPVSEGGFNNSLVEDLDGDGDPTEVGPAVSVFGELIRDRDLGLTKAQARKLNWNAGSPKTEVTVADMVTLFGEKIRAD